MSSALLSGPVALVVGRLPGDPRRLISIQDVRTGRELPTQLTRFDAITAFAAEPGGLAAWVERSGAQDLVRAARGDFESHTITRRAAPLTDLAVKGSTVTFADGGQSISVTMPRIRRTRITVSPRSGTPETPFVLLLMAPAVLGRPVAFSIAVGSTQSYDNGSQSFGCDWIGSFGRRGPGRVRLALGPLGALADHCPGRQDGWLLADYGARDPGRCDATPMPCAGTLPLGTFKFRVR